MIVDDDEYLVGLPLLLDDYCPWLAGLPLYILKLATEVEYTVGAVLIYFLCAI